MRHTNDKSPSTVPALRARRRWLPLLAAILLVPLLGPAHSPADGIGYSPVVDEPASYDAQRTCTDKPKPGTVALARHLLRSFPNTRSMGMMRSCGSGGGSEHKDGRAFDWGADVRHASTRKSAYTFISRILASDAAGNEHALARRMGIMYFIYDDKIWASYRDFEPRPYLNRGCSSLKTCSPTLRHLDHVHISLGLAGAAAQTSWYRARNVPSLPVLFPGTRDLDPDNTAVTGFTVPADGTSKWSSWALRPGVTYRIVVTGRVSYANGVSGDANCTWASGSTAMKPTPRGLLIDPNPVDEDDDDWGWGDDPGDDWGGDWGGVPGSDHLLSLFALPLPTTRGLLLDGALRWEDTTCREDHTYEAWYTPLLPKHLLFRYADTSPEDNRGSFKVYVARDDIVRSSLAG